MRNVEDSEFTFLFSVFLYLFINEVIEVQIFSAHFFYFFNRSRFVFFYLTLWLRRV